MKAPVILATGLAAALFGIGGMAFAKPAPVEVPSVASWHDAATIYSGPTAALREQSYFQAPQPSSFAGRVFPCRLQLRVFDKTQTARACN